MWFTEDALTPCAVFSAAGLFAVLVGWQSRRVRTGLFGFLMILVGVSAFSIDALVVTPREEIENRVRRLCDDFRNKRLGTLDYFSTTAPELKVAASAALALVTVESDPTLTDFQIQFTNEGSRATSRFRANANVSVAGYGHVGHQPSRFILTWAREGNDWKIIKVQRMHPVQDRELGLLDQRAG